MSEAYTFPHIKNITVSGRIASGATSLAKKLSAKLGWELLEGGEIMGKIDDQLGLTVVELDKRPDNFDLEYEERVKHILKNDTHQIIQSHLAGFDAQGIDNVFKILVICEDLHGQDHPEIRIDRLVNRDDISIEDAKYEVKEREQQHLTKFRRLYANNDPEWYYWDRKYYDFVISTYEHNKDETLRLTLAALGYTDTEK